MRGKMGIRVKMFHVKQKCALIGEDRKQIRVKNVSRETNIGNLWSVKHFCFTLGK